jgi:hypothetical protein
LFTGYHASALLETRNLLVLQSFCGGPILLEFAEQKGFQACPECTNFLRAHARGSVKMARFDEGLIARRWKEEIYEVLFLQQLEIAFFALSGPGCILNVT